MHVVVQWNGDVPKKEWQINSQKEYYVFVDNSITPRLTQTYTAIYTDTYRDRKWITYSFALLLD